MTAAPRQWRCWTSRPRLPRLHVASTGQGNERGQAHRILSRFFCELPFSYAEIHRAGKVYLCCPSYSGGRAIGNVFTDPPEKIWNSYRAQAIRAGIHDVSFRLCHHTKCPALAGRDLDSRQRLLASPELGPISPPRRRCCPRVRAR